MLAKNIPKMVQKGLFQIVSKLQPVVYPAKKSLIYCDDRLRWINGYKSVGKMVNYLGIF